MMMYRTFSHFTISIGLLVNVSAAAFSAKSIRNENSLHAHFQGLVDKQAHTFSHASPLPLAAAGPILHVDLDLVSRKPTVRASFFDALLEDETATRAAAASDSRFPYVLCGPQSSSIKARREISAASGPSHRTQVVYSSRLLDVACWKGRLRSADAKTLESSESFFHVAPVPKISKLAPGLVQRLEVRHQDGDAAVKERLAIHALAFSQGITVYFDPSSTQDERRALHHHWIGTKYGLAVAAATEDSFVPTTWAKSTADAASWVDKNVAGLECSSVLSVGSVQKYDGLGSLFLGFELLTKEEVNAGACYIAALYHIASSSKVAGLEVTKKMRTLGQLDKTKIGRLRGRASDTGDELESSFANTGVLNNVAVTALQSGDSNKPYPFWSAGIDGSNQFVQVTDTGFDDASCFLRDTDESKSALMGPFDFDVQLLRSTYDSPITNYTRRKIVQYIEVSNSSDTYAYDYEDGHGTHVAGTVAGRLASDENNVTVKDYYPLCSNYSTMCNTHFCPTCPYANYCDEMCGFLDDEDFTGMAPSAKIMAFDFGDGSGALATVSDHDTMMYAPAYDAGARIFCNSWGSVGYYYNTNDNSWIGTLYDGDSVMMDNLIYNYDDALVVFAAGNEGSSFDGSGDTTGDHSILDPGTSKNVLTVGAAETETTPSTVAAFSSRGPTTGNRIKPEVCGPGDPIYSACSSGSPADATCRVSQKSGTSMATPAVAGAAALVRQFLVDGMHEIYSRAGYAGSDYDSSHPSSALLKAMLIGSTMPLTTGYNSIRYPVTLANFYSASSPISDSAPYALGTTGVDYHQGFGHVLLSNVLSLDGGFDTFLYESSLDAYGSFTLQFTVNSTATEIDITLVWLDPPGSEYCDYYDSGCLVHDLDLRVTHNGNRLYSNFGAAKTGTYAGEEDTINNVEKTTIASSALSVGDSIAVVVTTDSGLAGASSQKFALVVTGNVALGIQPTDASVDSDSSLHVIIGAVVAGLLVFFCGAGMMLKLYLDRLKVASGGDLTGQLSATHASSTQPIASLNKGSDMELMAPPRTTSPLRQVYKSQAV